MFYKFNKIIITLLGVGLTFNFIILIFPTIFLILAYISNIKYLRAFPNLIVFLVRWENWD